MIDIVSNVTVNDEYLNNIVNNNCFAMAMSLYDATFNPSPVPPTSAMVSGGAHRCNLTCFYSSSSRSRAVAGCNAFANEMCGPSYGCTKLFSVDSGCLWGDYCCVATQEVSCPC